MIYNILYAKLIIENEKKYPNKNGNYFDKNLIFTRIVIKFQKMCQKI